MAETIARTICLIHPGRPAEARCPQCKRFFCGECITEHDGRLICAQCLREGRSQEREVDKRRSYLLPILQWGVGLLLIWMFFYGCARILMLVPTAFHDGTVWE
jgi:hypothetical protein